MFLSRLLAHGEAKKTKRLFQGRPPIHNLIVELRDARRSAVEDATRAPYEDRLGTIRRRARRGVWTEHVGNVRGMVVQRRRLADGNVVKLDADPIVLQKDLRVRNGLHARRPGHGALR